MRALLFFWGTRGDFQPLLALAHGLRDSGHGVHLSGASTYGREAEAAGFEFTPVGTDLQALFEHPETAVGSSTVQVMGRLIGRLGAEAREQIHGLAPLARRADVVVGSGAAIGPHSAADAAGVPYRFATFSPATLPSAHHPPLILPVPPPPQWVIRGTWRGADVLARRVFSGPVNQTRAALGLPPVRDVLGHLLPPGKTIAAYDPELARPPEDLELAAGPTGFWHMPADGALPQEVEDFLDDGPPPVFVGFGSVPDARPSKTASIVLEALAAVGCRAIVSLPVPVATTRTVLDVRRIPHQLLFPRMAAVVHHGGAGTTAVAARAGVRQVIVPHYFDQFDWGRRAQAAGLAPKPFSRRRLSAGKLAGMIRAALADEQMRERATETGRRLRARDGVSEAIAVLESAAESG